MKNTNSKPASSGFTLIELSIVLVIIGLIVGGVLVGRDMIQSAQIRATISQFEKLNAAVNTFELKYNGLPGDLLRSDALASGLYVITHPPYIGFYGYGDGNGIIKNGNGATNTPTISNILIGEPLMFWRQLSDAQLIDGIYGRNLNIAAESNPVAEENINTYFPPAKIGKSSISAQSPGDGRNYFLLSNVTSITGAGSYGSAANPLTAVEAYQIDSKMDDGIPNTGIVFAVNALLGLGPNSTWTTVSGLSGCVSASAYATNPGDTKSCSLRIRFQ